MLGDCINPFNENYCDGGNVSMYYKRSSDIWMAPAEIVPIKIARQQHKPISVYAATSHCRSCTKEQARTNAILSRNEKDCHGMKWLYSYSTDG